MTLAISSQLYLVPNRYSALHKAAISGLNAINLGLYKALFSSLLMTLLVINLAGNIPGFSIPTLFYFFSSSISITFWLALFLVIVVTQLKSFMAHILPYGSPEGLILVLPIIEIFSQVIRPFTLIIRLRTNLSSGHIIMYMFSFFRLARLPLTLMIGVAMLVLFSLELIISCLQAYIFSSLVVLYVNETVFWGI